MSNETKKLTKLTFETTEVPLNNRTEKLVFKATANYPNTGGTRLFSVKNLFGEKNIAYNFLSLEDG